MTLDAPAVVPWTAHLTEMVGFDTETTGVDVETCRIVTASMVNISGSNATPWTVLINPGVDIPAEATAVHGITTEHARGHGQAPAEALRDIVCRLAMDMCLGVPLVGMNVPFDLTILDRECRRHGVPTLGERLAEERGNGDQTVSPVIDVMVLDKAVDRFRKGSRKLTSLCATYRVRIDDAHNAEADALAALRVAWRMGWLTEQDTAMLDWLFADRSRPEESTKAWRGLAGMSLHDLHTAQVGWAAEQAESFRDYLVRSGNPERAATVRGDWPIIPGGVS